jgi:hypothetical protein
MLCLEDELMVSHNILTATAYLPKPNRRMETVPLSVTANSIVCEHGRMPDNSEVAVEQACVQASTQNQPTNAAGQASTASTVAAFESWRQEVLDLLVLSGEMRVFDS